MFPPWRLALLVPVIALIPVGGCDRAQPLPPPPPVSVPTAPTPTVPTAAVPMMPTTASTPTTGTAPSGAPLATAPPPELSVALSADAVVCAAALHCCESTAHAARRTARREGIDPRYDPRRDARYDARDDPGHDPRIRRAVSRLVSGCRELRNPDAAHASRCAQQIESIRRAFREVGAPVPSTCRVPDLSSAMPAQRTDR